MTEPRIRGVVSSSATKRSIGRDESEALIALLREYTDKFNNLSNGYNRALSAPQDRLRVVAHELASYASQQIEYAGLDEITRLELKMRLAEFEAALLGVETAQ